MTGNDFFISINKNTSDKILFYTFSNFLLRTVLSVPITKDAIVDEHNVYFHNRFLCLFQKQETCGFIILRFLECCLWVLRDLEVNLSDDKFEHSVNELSIWLKKELSKEERLEAEKYIVLPYYASDEQYEMLMKDFNNFSLDYLKEHVDKSKRVGQSIWGPIYWAFLHRFIYRFEKKLTLIKNSSDVTDPSINLIQNCFTTLYWFLKIWDELLPCKLCSHNYLYFNFGNKLAETLMIYYPTNLFHPSLNDDNNFVFNYYKLNMMSIHFFLLHHYHTYAILRRSDDALYDIFTFLNEISQAKKND